MIDASLTMLTDSALKASSPEDILKQINSRKSTFYEISKTWYSERDLSELWLNHLAKYFDPHTAYFTP